MDDKMPSPNPQHSWQDGAHVYEQAPFLVKRGIGQTSTAIFRVGKNAVQSMNDALLSMTDPARRDITWAAVPNGSNDQRDLLIAYLEEDPDIDIPLTSFFADMESNPAQDLATYEARTAHIHGALRLREKPGRDSHIQLIALSKIDPGRAQVVFSGSYSTAAIYAGRDRWLTGARNVPSLQFPFPLERESLPSGVRLPAKSGGSHGQLQAPVAAGRSNESKRSGSRSWQHLWDSSGARCDCKAFWLLDRYLGLTEPLLIGLARALSGGAGLSEPARKEALIAIAAYGILLLRQGREKEKYMESRDYLLGQFLQFADLLHRLYCVHERKGSIPPQLIGNAAIPMALQSPRRAIQVLGNRIPVYLAWADRYQDEGAGLAKWSRKELGRLSTVLKDEKLDLRVSTNGKAELLLGYLANAKQKEKQENLYEPRHRTIDSRSDQLEPQWKSRSRERSASSS